MLTLESFLERVDNTLLAQLSSEDGSAVNTTRVTHALNDAWGVIDGYVFTLAPAAIPGAATLEAHQRTLALAALAGNRQGAELDAIRSAADASITYLEGLRSGTQNPNAGGGAGGTIDLSSSAPAPLFDDTSLEEFGRTGEAS